MQLNINASYEQALYIQIYEQIKLKIMTNEWSSGDKLPSKRQLARDNGISQNTVLNAYNQLLIEGYIFSEERRGYYVADVKFQETSLPKIRQVQTSISLETKDVQLLDLTRSNADADLFPFSIFQKIYRQLLSSKQEQLLLPSDGKGLAELRHAVGLYLTESRGVSCSAEQIILGPSSQYLLSLLFPLLKKQLAIGIEDPGYHGYSSLFKQLNIKEYPVSLDNYGINVSELGKTSANIALVTPNHQYPTGTIMPLERRQELLRWASGQPERFIIEDDYDSEFKYSGIPVPPLIQLDRHERVIYIGSFTRTLSPSMRLSYMVLPHWMIENFEKEFQGLSPSLNTLSQWTMQHFILNGHLTTHLNRSRSHYKKKRDALISAIKKEDPNARIFGEEAGLSLLVAPTMTFSGRKLKKLAYAEDIQLSLLSDYARIKRPEDEKIIFLSFSSIPYEKISKIVKKIASLMSLSIEK